MNRFNGSAPVPMDAECASWVTSDSREDCCECRLGTRKLWFNAEGKRIAHACCFEHLAAEYPRYTTDTTDWEAA